MEIPERYHIENTNFSSYWKPAHNNLLPHLVTDVSLEESKKCIPLYFETDQLGDAVADEYFTNTSFAKAIGALHRDFSMYLNNQNELSAATQTLFAQLHHIPDWVDFEKINLGASYCQRCGTAALSVLRNYCLMGGYESSAINKPLIFTQSLHKGAVKRLADTVDFWMNVTTSNGLKPQQKGVYSILTTRLIHSYSRLQIEKSPEWKSELWGKPINLWDMQATNLGFSIAFMDGLTKLNFAPTDEECSAVLHLWKYAGYLLGIPAELLPDDASQAARSLYLWSKSQKGIDQDSKDLAWALYDEPLRVSFTNNRLMKWFVQKTNLGYNEVLLGTESRAALGLPSSKAKYWILLLNQINKYVDRKAKSDPKSYHKIVAKGRKEQEDIWDLYKKA